MDRLLPDEYNKVSIVDSIIGFLNPETTYALRTSTRGYRDAVNSIGSRQETLRRQVQEIVGMPVRAVAGDEQHLWDLTYRLVSTDPFALYYTGSATDDKIAQQMGAQKTDNTAPSSVQTHLHNAAIAGYADVFEVLLKAEPGYPNTDDGSWWTLISYALDNSRLNILSLLAVKNAMAMMTPADVDDCLEDALEVATNMSPDALDFFLGHSPRPAVHALSNHVYSAIKNGMYGVVKVLLSHDLVDFSASLLLHSGRRKDEYRGREWDVVWLSINYGHLSILRLLLTDPRSQSILMIDYSLETAVRHGYVEIVRLMLDLSPIDPMYGVDWIDNTYLNTAVRNNLLGMTQLLLSYNSICLEMPYIARALSIAVNNDSTEIAMVLLNDPRCTGIPPGDVARMIATARFNDNAVLLARLQ